MRPRRARRSPRSSRNAGPTSRRSRERRDRRARPDCRARRDRRARRAGRSGACGDGPPLRLLIVGDSSAAGVGVDLQDDALAGRLAARLGAQTRPIAWRLVARTGTATREAPALLDAEAREAGDFDVAVVALGVNDVTALRPVGRFLADVDALHTVLRERHRVGRVLWSGLPPMHRFPAFPQPLRAVMGLHARALDAALARWCETRSPGTLPSTMHVPLPPMTDVSMVASDGFHPGPAAYEAWARTLAARIAG